MYYQPLPFLIPILIPFILSSFFFLSLISPPVPSLNSNTGPCPRVASYRWLCLQCCGCHVDQWLSILPLPYIPAPDLSSYFIPSPNLTQPHPTPYEPFLTSLSLSILVAVHLHFTLYIFLPVATLVAVLRVVTQGHPTFQKR